MYPFRIQIDKMSAKELVSEKIKEKKVFVISKSYCPYCKKAKAVLKNYKINPDVMEIMEIDNRKDMDDIQVS